MITKLIKEITKANNSVEIFKELVFFIDDVPNYEFDKDRKFSFTQEVLNVLNNTLSKKEVEELDIVKFDFDNVLVSIKNTAIRFKVRKELNELGFKCEVVVVDKKTFIKVSSLDNLLNRKTIKKIELKLEEMKEWAKDYIETLDEQVQQAELKDVVDGQFSMIELEEEKRILVKISYNDRLVFKGLFKSAKWDAEFKSWRISNIKSNKEKLEVLATKLTKI